MGVITDEQYFSEWNSDSIIVITTATLSIYNSCELLLMIAARFKEKHSLYFISLIISSFGVIPYFSGFLCEFFQALPFWASMLLSSIGWVSLITGQAFVLYSRLGLILSNARILKAVKWMIIIDAIVFHITTTVIQYGKAYGGQRHAFAHALFYVEKIQMTGFCIQEFIISGLYLWKAAELLKVIQRQGTRKVMLELLVINIIIVFGDIALLVLEYSGARLMERTFKGLIYSVKLKLEFAILSKLVDLVQSSQRTLSTALADVNTFVDVSRTTTGIDGFPPPTRRRTSDEMPDWLVKLEDRHIQTLHLENVDVEPSNSEKGPDFITRKEV